MDNAVVDLTTYAAASDLSSYQFYPVKVADGAVSLAGANEAHGILQNDPKLGEAACIRIFGISYAMANGATDIAIFNNLASDANNLLIKDESTDNGVSIATALEAYTVDATAKIKVMVNGKRRW